MKINVILKKEDIERDKLSDNHLIIVLDILLATSTIVSMLEHGAKKILPVTSEMEALSLWRTQQEDSPLLVGEQEGYGLEKFLSPNPLLLREKVKGRSVILLTTNGTVAIRTVAGFPHVYVGSLLNGRALAQEVYKNYRHIRTIQIICSGSSNQFCMEDFYGAGFVINELLQTFDSSLLELTDSARSSYLFYNFFATTEEGERILQSSQVGKLLNQLHYGKVISYVNSRNIYTIVPKLSEKKLILKN
ncbi:MAG TPA: 2-phosphosulfolactate phosphatase [Pseudogracilibacillus sp.]|nr:2-phosphosulfolactate phosphatase [Pseudogracilibacillus sp.]